MTIKHLAGEETSLYCLCVGVGEMHFYSLLVFTLARHSERHHDLIVDTFIFLKTQNRK